MSSSNRTTAKGGKGIKSEKANKLDKSDTGMSHILINQLNNTDVILDVQEKDPMISSKAVVITYAPNQMIQ